MPSENSVILANTQRKNLPHIASNLNVLEPLPLLNGLFKFEHKEQAYNLPCSHRYHQIQTITSVQPNAFTNTNTFFDFNLPMNIDLIDDEVIEMTLVNNDASNNWVANASVPFWFQRVEIRIDGEIKQTLRDIQLYLENTMYIDDFERTKLVPMIGINKSTYKADASVLAIAKSGGTKTLRLRLNTFLAKCNLFLKGIKGQVVYRFYPQSINAFSNSAANSSIQLQSTLLLIRECELTADGRNKMQQIHKSNVDYRYLDALHEQTVVSMTAGSTTKYVSNNFHDSIYSHVVVLTRASNPTLTNLETFVEHANVYFEDVSSMNLSNGIQWKSDDLKQIVYQSHFPNTMTQAADMNVYVPLVASLKPAEANSRGINNGWEILPRNSKICILPLATAANQIDIVAYVYTHCRLENGKVSLF
jgi:hypothetical protein